MTKPAETVDQNILPVQAYFNLDGSFNTFIGQGQPFIVSATESIGIINTSVNGTFYPTFTAVSTGQVTSLSVTSLDYKYNPGTGVLSAPYFSGALLGTATEANNIAGGSASQLLYQTSANTTGFVPNGISGQFLVSNGTSAPSWSSVATSVTIVDQTTSSSTFYPLFYSATSGSTNTVETSSTKLQYVPSTGTFTSTVFSGSGAGLTNIPNSALTNSSFTLGSTSISLGSTTTTIAGLTSVTSTTFVGALTGNASTATTATTATNATNIGITDNTSSIATWYPMIVSNTTGNLPATTSSTKLSFVPNTGILSATTFSGSGASLTSIPNSALVNSAITINGVSTALGGSASVGTVTSVAATAGTGISVSGSPITGSGTLNITNTEPDQTVVLNNGTGISVTGTYPNFTVTNTAPSSGGTVTSVTATAPVASTGGTTPVISMPAATTSVSGYLTSTDWNTFNNKSNTTGTVTSVSATVPSFLSVSGSPITTSGTLALTYSGTALPVGNGGTGLTTLTANYIPYGNGTSALSSSSNLQFTGTNLLLDQSYDQGTGVLQVTGASSFNGAVVDKSLNLQGGNNLLPQSQNFTVSPWTTASGASTVTANSGTAPDGTNTLNLVTATAGSGYHEFYSTSYYGSAGTLTESFYIKAGTSNFCSISVSNTGSNYAVATFNLASPTAATKTGSAGTFTYVSSSITLVGNGIYRATLTYTGTGTAAVQFAINSSATPTYGSYGMETWVAVGTETIYAWGAQLELGSVASAYTPTTTAAVTTTNNINVPSGSLTINAGNLNIQRPIATTQVAPTIASAATIAPITYITFISGTTTINTITVPSPLSTYGGQLILIPTGLFLTGITGNIAIASTTVVGKALIMIYDTTTAKWYPSY